MKCRHCSAEPEVACKVCGRFYCQKHVGNYRRVPLCIDCWNAQRPQSVTGACFFAAMGLFFGAMAARVGAVLLLPSLCMFAMAVGIFQVGRRPFPGEDRGGLD